MAAIDDLRTAWESEIATISNALRKAKATYLLDGYITAIQAMEEADSSEIQSYSIAGRSINFKTPDQTSKSISSMENRLVKLIYGSTSYINMNKTSGNI